LTNPQLYANGHGQGSNALVDNLRRSLDEVAHQKNMICRQLDELSKQVGFI
jgi:hypothetical protein